MMDDTSQEVVGPTLALNLAGVAKALGVSLRTAQHWRQRGILPEPDLACGRVLRWSLPSIRSWLEGRKGGANAQ